jgi:hypothetical protein
MSSAPRNMYEGVCATRLNHGLRQNKRKKTNFPVSWKTSIHYLKRIDLSYLSIIVYEIYGFHWCKFNHFNLQFKMRKNSPVITNSYPLSGGNPLSKAERLCFYSCKNGLTGSATQPSFIIKYRYCIRYISL